MTLEHAVMAILFALFLGAMSPGPSFLFVARLSVTATRADGVAAAMGVATAGQCYCALGLLGLNGLLLRFPWLGVTIKLGGGMYLSYLAIRIWCSAKKPMMFSANVRASRVNLWLSFKDGFMVQILNPKALVVYGTVFAALLPQSLPMWVYGALPPMIFLIEVAWYGFVAVCFSAASPRALYLKRKELAERMAATAVAMLALRLFLAATLLD